MKTYIGCYSTVGKDDKIMYRAFVESDNLLVSCTVSGTINETIEKLFSLIPSIYEKDFDGGFTIKTTSPVPGQIKKIREERERPLTIEEHVELLNKINKYLPIFRS